MAKVILGLLISLLLVLSWSGEQGVSPLLSTEIRSSRYPTSDNAIPLLESQDHHCLISSPLPVRLRQFTTSEADERGFAWGRDGLVYFSSDRSGYRNILSMHLNKTKLREHYPYSVRREQPAVFIGSHTDRLAYVSDRDGDGHGPFNIWVETRGEDEERSITTGEGDKLWPAWSPDGEWLVFSWQQGGNWDLWLISFDGAELRRLTSTPYNERFPAFSPDGKWIVYSSDQDGDDDLWMMRADGRVFRQLTATAASEVEPRWSPDGRKIAFSSDLSGSWDIWLVDLEGTLLTPVTSDPAEDRYPVWSLDGKTIAFESNRAGDWDIWMAEILPLEPVQRIAFTRGKDGEQEILLIDPDGSNEFQLTHNDVWDGEVAWAPSGHRLAFVRAIPKREYAAHEVGYLARDELWVINADGSSPRLILSDQLQRSSLQRQEALWGMDNLHNLQWALDESALYFETMAAVTSNAIWSVNLDGSNSRILCGGNDLVMTARGHFFFFKHNYYPIGDEPLARDEFYLVDRDGNELRCFKDLYNLALFLSPDETKLIYFVYDDSERGLEEGVYLLELETGETVKLMERPREAAFRPSPGSEYLRAWLEWSPDGRKILYVSDREGNQEIYLMDLETREEMRLTDNAAPDYTPSWSPDGRQIAFVSERDGNPEIYVMAADGSAQIRLTDNPEPDLDPRWSPRPVPRLLGFEVCPGDFDQK